MVSRTRAELRRPAEFGGAEMREMFRLYETYFEETSWEIFSGDLAGKDYVILLRAGDGLIRGFSALSLMRGDHEGSPFSAIFSGDTIIDREFWGEQTLPMAWCRLAGEIQAARPEDRLYWFLISKGYRTYRYLPLFSRVYYPSCHWETPPHVQRLMDRLAAARFGGCYDPSAGVVRFPRSRGQLREEWAGVKSAVLAKPEVRFFLERNPGYGKGEELVCLTELSAANMRAHARRAFLEGLAGQGLRDEAAS